MTIVLRSLFSALLLMAGPWGFNFRNTSAFVTDGANETYVISSDTYPTTRNGITFGYTAGPESTENNSSGIDRRIAGNHQNTNDGTQDTFRADVPASDLLINLAVGNNAFDQGYCYAQVRDNTTARITVNDADGVAATHWDDATGVDRTLAAWPGSNVPAQANFSSGILILAIGSPTAQAASTPVSHLKISEVSSTDSAAQQPRVAKPLTLMRRRPLGPGNPLREVKYYEIPNVAFNSGPVDVTPDLGALVLDGFAPTIQLPINVAPALGQLQLDGFAPSITLPINLRPGLGALILTGFSPTIGLPVTVQPQLGQLVLTGFVPAIQSPITVLPGLGQLILDGFAPSIALPVSLRPGLGQLILSGFTPTIALPINLGPGLGQLILNGLAPTIGSPVTLRPGLAQLVLDGFNPFIISGGVTVQPGMGQLILTGFAPSITLPVTLKPGLGALTLNGLAPTIGVPITVRPGIGLLVFTGLEPTIVVIGSSETMALIGVLNTFPRLSGVTDAFTELTGEADAFVRLTGSTDAFVALAGEADAFVALTGIVLLYPEEA